MSETKVNSSLFSKFKKTQVNSIQKLPDITGLTIDGFHVDSRLDIVSGEADIYLCSRVKGNSGKSFLLKYYRRENAVKPDVIEKLKTVSSPCVAPIEGFGEYEGHQYVVRPYYEMSALSELLAEGTRFSEEDLTNLIIPSIIEGLKAVHDAGILHKDLKPANMIPDDNGQHIVLIDFGISSDAGKNTFVVTQTGMTPFYAAPEAMQGIFHRETDYYALGITIFELFTGFTPFQNPGITGEEAARLASISKIEFPANFPENLKKLVLGLTYKDISHRNEKENPNRRWGYDEVKRWFRGEDVPVPGESVGPIHKFLPYSFNGTSCTTPEELAKAILKDPDRGLRDLGRGLLTHHFGLFDNDLARHCNKAEGALNSDRGQNLKILHQLIHALVPEERGLYFLGREFSSFAELASFLFGIAVRISGGNEIESDHAVANDAVLYLHQGIWESYADNVLSSPALTWTLHSLSEMTKANDSEGETLLAIGYALSESCREIVCHGRKFSDLQAFGKELVAVSSRGLDGDPFLEKALDIFKTKGFQAYLTFVLGNDSKVKELLSDIERTLSRKTLDSCSLSEKTLYVGYRLSGSFIFRMGDRIFESIQIWDQYLERFAREDRVTYLRVLNDNRHVLEYLKNVFSGTSLEIMVQKRLDDTTCAVFGDYEYQFRNGQEFNQFLEKLVREKRFSELRKIKEKYGEALTLLDGGYWKNDSLAKLERALSQATLFDNLRERLNAVFVSYAPSIITINGLPALSKGAYVKFGSYPQNRIGVKEPIEWLVLEINGNETLLISRYGLECIQYHHKRADITWENCDLRKWLNNAFMNTAFSEEEQRRIKLSEIVNDDNPQYGTSGGNNTQDRVFCLSIAEGKRYFRNDSERKSRPTVLAKAHGATCSGDGGYCMWWLRSPGYHPDCVSGVFSIYPGSLTTAGFEVTRSCMAVRPVLRLIWNQ